jgi:hypothetical protein
MITFPVAPNEYSLKTKERKVFISAVRLLLQVKMALQRIPISQRYRYQAPGEPIVDGVHFLIPEAEPKTKMPLRVILQKGPEYGFKATMMLEEKTPKAPEKGTGKGRKRPSGGPKGKRKQR